MLTNSASQHELSAVTFNECTTISKLIHVNVVKFYQVTLSMEVKLLEHVQLGYYNIPT